MADSGLLEGILLDFCQNWSDWQNHLNCLLFGLAILIFQVIKFTRIVDAQRELYGASNTVRETRVRLDEAEENEKQAGLERNNFV